MRIHAIHRLRASTQQDKLYQFLMGLSEEQRTFFYEGLPKALYDWLDGMGTKKQSDHLQMQFASKYRKVDAIAVALGHLKAIYPPKMHGMIYRSVLIPKDALPTTTVLDFKSGPQWSALQSWTYLPMPQVMDRNVKPEKQIDLILELRSAEAQKHVVTDNVQLELIARDARAILKTRTDLGGFSSAYWNQMQNRLRDFFDEEEVMLYVPAGTSLRCTWRAFRIDKYDNRLPIEDMK